VPPDRSVAALIIGSRTGQADLLVTLDEARPERDAARGSIDSRCPVKLVGEPIQQVNAVEDDVVW